MSDTPPQQIIVIKSEKSVGLAVALAFFFGPLGLLYSTPAGAIVMFIVNCCILVLALLTMGLGLLLFLFTWPTCAIWAWKAASRHNQQLHAAASK